MKGNPEEPRCGFSNAVCQVLRHHGVNKIPSLDVLQDDEMRQAVKDYSNWPTIPQVYINGEFLGGCDLMIEEHKSGGLIQHLANAGITSRIAPDEETK